jgi:hypothetical protein
MVPTPLLERHLPSRQSLKDFCVAEHVAEFPLTAIAATIFPDADAVDVRGLRAG